MKELILSERELGGAPLVALEGDLNFDTAPRLRDVLAKLVKKRPGHIVVDLGALSFMDTCGLATLIETRQKMDKHRKRNDFCLVSRS